MNKPNLLDELAKRPLLCDGAMGTQLMAHGLAPGHCGELWNVERPEIVRSIHATYLKAGCDLVTTNTFGGTSAALAKHDLSGQVAELNEAGARLGKEAVAGLKGRLAWVLGDVGPFGGFLEPVGEATAEEVLAMFAAQVKALVKGGVDGFIIETMSDPQEMVLAIRAARENSKLPIVATFAFDHGEGASFRTMMGATVEQAVGAAISAGASVVGANCGTSLTMTDYLQLAEEIIAVAGTTPVILQPNAGTPLMKQGKLVYGAIPADMAELAAGLLDVGVRIVGGCCGTTPAHLAAMSGVVHPHSQQT